MLARILTTAFRGIEAQAVEAQCQLSAGLPAFNLVGLADKAVAESKERVRAALTSLGIGLPAKRITVNLAPADLPKEGSHYDLPIALALLGAMEAAPAERLAEWLAMGELSLDGALNPVPGVLPAALLAAERGRGMICPAACASEAAWVGATKVLGAQSLLSLLNHFNGRTRIAPAKPGGAAAPEAESAALPDLREVRGQEGAKRALEVAAAGGHNLLMMGPPGAGKSMLAARAPGLLPPLEPREALEVSLIHSVAGLLKEGRVSMRRPFRAPHHSASMAALVGGGRRAGPGEASLAHRGVLFLDETPEFQPQVLEALRQPLETGEILVSRAEAHVRYPARFQLIAAMNPCRCGYLTDPTRACSRAPRCGMAYQERLSGPFLDRIDLQIEVPALPLSDLAAPPPKEGSREAAARVARARRIQAARHQALGLGARLNAEVGAEALEEAMEPAARTLALKAAEALRLSARGHLRLLRLARTLADLEESESLRPGHVAEAASFRRTPLQG
ncbi:YifB family Mg chelatase-like AAA ATPase [Neomegalonema sp.]|uniref:YifB family Mg chelatase-like AAA ATPase n=1 Tax=Neomegalonema sp. TaxID=2039713 RepID=UPI0026206C6A|nr:YifB family Mg chelatase-like AAA ATPase [Neomegalonema sp.]MDD2868620.1 YifB family Mg chelatase-like AAA ATPase [Neomegalonema sp.]